MLNNLIFSLNAIIPVFLLMVLGLFFHKIGWIDDTFASKMNKFVFRVPLPVLLFYNLATVDFSQVWDTRFVLFCFFATLGGILIAALVSLLFDRSLTGEFIQGAYRSSAALLGIALVQNIYGKAEIAPLMIIGSVPLYNVVAVLVLSLFAPPHDAKQNAAVLSQNTDNVQCAQTKTLVRQTIIGILTNPIILGIIVGCIWSGFHLPLPVIAQKTVANVAATATPLGLMAMGATFDIHKAFARLLPAVTASFLKLFGLCAIFLPLAAVCGFREEKLISILVMLGSATTVSSFVMAKNMGHEGTLSSSIVMLTTLFSAFSLTLWLFVLRSLGLI